MPVQLHIKATILINNLQLNKIMAIIILLIVIGVLVYFIPSFVAHGKVHFKGILLLNIFLGWTLLGWLASLIWAVTSPRDAMKYIYTCIKCGYKGTLNQKVKIYVCPQCKTETEYDDL